ncbi:MAG: hypothetical protein ACYC6C_11745 [Coriobacteriia bacterium]|jgi:hypothetical protein
MPLIDTLLTAAELLPAQIPNPDPVQPPGTEGVTTVMSWAKWIGFALAGIAIIIVAVRMFFNSRRGEGGEHAGALGWILGGVILIGGGVGLVTALMGA